MSTVCRSAVQEIIPLSYKTLGTCVTGLHAVTSLNEQDEPNYLLGVNSSFPLHLVYCCNLANRKKKRSLLAWPILRKLTLCNLTHTA